MNRTMIFLIHPPKHPGEVENFDEQDNIAFCDSEEEFQARWDEAERLQAVLKELGFKPPEHGRGYGYVQTANIEGCNWEGSCEAEIWTISEQNLQLLEGKAEEARSLRETALAKLSTQEQIALGLLKQE